MERTPGLADMVATLWNCLVSETVRLLFISGFEPPIFVRINVAGAAGHNQVLMEKWRPRNIHL